MFEPIAIVGRGCVLPGATTPDALWEAVRTGQDLLTEVPEGAWPVPAETVRRRNRGPGQNGGTPAAPFRGGFVQDFEQIFNPADHDLPADELEHMDRASRWLLHAGRAAFLEAGSPDVTGGRCAVVVGNLAYPSHSMTELLYQSVIGNPHGDLPEAFWRQRFSSGRPANLFARSIGADGPAFCIDAACASSLYAIKLACDYLHDGKADIAFAGGLNGCYNFLLHTGFDHLQALSPTGQSRPFHRGADGLIPSEGAAVIALRRLSDALASGDRVLAVIRGVGLSNDGRRRGVLVPDQDGQVRALRAAYEDSGIDPASIGYLECHATGTPTGDKTEIGTLKQVYSGVGDLPVSSLKSNLGHLVTVAGMAAVLKVIGAFSDRLKPRTLYAEEAFDELRSGSVRPLLENEDWHADTVRRAGVNNFGFGGNNAHLILEEFTEESAATAHAGFRDPAEQHAARSHPQEDIVICGVGVAVGDQRGGDAFRSVDPKGRPDALAHDISLPIKGTAFPPNDLKKCLGQQTLAIEASIAAFETVVRPEAARIGLVLGMGCDFEAARHCMVWRAEGARLAGELAEGTSFEDLHAAIAPLEKADAVLGAMPNLVANRVNIQLDISGFGYSISAEELSGSQALEIGCRALRRGELDAFLAGAVDLSTEAVHRQCCAGIADLADRDHIDAAGVFVLKRRADAERCGDPILASIDVASARFVDAPATRDGTTFSDRVGYAHAAASSLDIAEFLLKSGPEEADTDTDTDTVLSPDERRTLTSHSMTGWRQAVSVRRVVAPALRVAAPQLRYCAAETAEDLADRLEAGRADTAGPVRIAVVGKSPDIVDKRIAYAIERLRAGEAPRAPGVVFSDTPIGGEVAFVYTGLGAAYPAALDELPAVFPDLVDRFLTDFAPNHTAEARTALAALKADPSVENQSFATGLISSFNTLMVERVLGLRPNACLGISMGEAVMFGASGVWEAPAETLTRVADGGLYRKLTGDHAALRSYLGLNPEAEVEWQSFEIVGPADDLLDDIKSVAHVWALIVYSPDHCLIGGLKEACTAFARRLDSRFSMIEAGHDLAFHGPFVEPVSDLFYDLHLQEATQRPDVTFYSNAIGDVWPVGTQTCARYYTDQAVQTVDFRPTVRAAWRDGVRTFIDIGPRAVLSTAMERILRGENVQIVAIDQGVRGGLYNLASACADLFARGHDVGIAALARRFDRLAGRLGDADQRSFTVPGHLPDIDRPFLASLARPPAGTPDQAKPDIVLAFSTDDAGKAGAGRVPPAPRLGGLTALPPARRNTRPPPRRRVMRAPDVSEGAPPAAEMGPTPTQAAVAGGLMTAAAASPAPHQRLYPYNDVPTPQPSEAMNKAIKSTAFDASGRVPDPIDPIAPSGPTLSREDLEWAARDKISAVFGPLFEQQDGYERQCRMPEPPMLLADRVTGIAGEPGTMGKGICWTETDVTADAWYLDGSYMPTGILIESGQADLLLISWLGCDFLNRSERVYRLLGCELTIHNRDMPKVGDTIQYQIHIDAHANLGGTRMFFFRYDARVNGELMVSVRHGQAGFFSDAELANSDGVLWSAEQDTPKADARMDPPPCVSEKRAFSAEEVEAFAAGDVYRCFGPGFENTAAHQKPAKIPDGRMRLIDSVEAFEPDGGPWGRGYLRAVFDVPPDAWFYDGHFHNDPCMPGTLMAEAGCQALQFHMAALGFTIDKDGYRFRPLAGEPFKFVCRGQVVPDAPHRVTYEIFVEEVIGGDKPVVYAAILARSDGFKVFLCRRFAVTLSRDWPLYTREAYLNDTSTPTIISPDGEVRGDHKALLAAAWGRPSEAFGPVFAAADPELDGTSNPPRLPGPPYHCMTRIIETDSSPARATPGGRLVSEYEVDPAAWYFSESGTGTMPFSVFSEVLLQPCGWFASYMGYALGKVVKFRNLDGEDVVLHEAVGPDIGTLRLETTFAKAAQVGPMTIVFYEVVCRAGERVVATLKTDFGFFPTDALANQKGLPATPDRRERIAGLNELAPIPESETALRGPGGAAMPTDKLDLVDDIVAFEPDGGAAGLGRAVGRQRIDPGAWYFKAHFFTDPVQPGSLGLEALFTLFKALVRLKGLDKRFDAPRFEAPATDQTLSWHYRGQVVPRNKAVITEFELTAFIEEDDALLVTGTGSLWVDGLRIYEVKDYALRIREAPAGARSAPVETGKVAGNEVPAAPVAVTETGDRVLTLDITKAPWLCGHKPFYAKPVYPMLGVAAQLLDIGPVARIRNLELREWLVLGVQPLEIALRTVRASDDLTKVMISRIENGVVQRKLVGMADLLATGNGEAPAAWETVTGGEVIVDPYRAGELFHDGSFKTVSEIARSEEATSFTFPVEDCLTRAGGDRAILLDTLFHGFPHCLPECWYGDTTRNHVAFPYRLEDFTLFAPLPEAGEGCVVTRKLDMPNPRLVRFEVQFQCDGRVIAQGTMAEALIRLDIVGRVGAPMLRQFCLSGKAVPGCLFSQVDGDGVTLTEDTVTQADRVPATTETIYGLGADSGRDLRATMEAVVIKDLVSREFGVHPAAIRIEPPLVIPFLREPVPLSAIALDWSSDSVTARWKR